MKKLLFPFVASLLLLAGAGSALVGCKDPSTAFNQQSLDRQNRYRAIDDSVIQAYLKRNNYGPGAYTRTDAGLYVINVSEAPQERPLARAGQRVSVRYEGRFITEGQESRIFDSSYNGRTLCNCVSFLIDDPNTNARAVPGFNDGLKLMRQGDRKLLIIPSYLAYGFQGSGSIGPDTPILFDLDIVAVTP